MYCIHTTGQLCNDIPALHATSLDHKEYLFDIIIIIMSGYIDSDRHMYITL